MQLESTILRKRFAARPRKPFGWIHRRIDVGRITS